MQSYLDSFSRDKESVSVECVTLSSHRLTNQREKQICLHEEKKEKFFWKAKTEEEQEETAAGVDEIASSTPSTSRVENQLSDLDPKGTFGSSRKKKKYADEELLLDSSDGEYTFNTEESEGYRLMDVKNLSTAVSNAHVCEEGEKFFEVYVVLCSRL